MQVVEYLQLAGYALGAFGGVLLFVEFFQIPSYVSYDEEFQSYSVDISPQEIAEHTWIGRVGGLCVALGFTALFLATLLG
ncbi:MAG: hypothetical protein ABEJ22_04270 [Haloferacaceae archaeon]